MVRLTPIERLRSAADGDATAEGYVEDALEHYAWFLDQVGRPTPIVLDWIGKRENRDVAFGRGREFGVRIFDLILHFSSRKPFLRYLVV